MKCLEKDKEEPNSNTISRQRITLFVTVAVAVPLIGQLGQNRTDRL